MEQGSEKVLPRITPLGQKYFDGCRQGELRLQFCRDCGHWQFYPRIVCENCVSEALEFRPASGAGRIASFTVIRTPVSPAYPVPFVVALVDLAEGPRMMSQIVDCAPEGVDVGARVTVAFRSWSEQWQLPVFTLDEGGNES